MTMRRECWPRSFAFQAQDDNKGKWGVLAEILHLLRRFRMTIRGECYAITSFRMTMKEGSPRHCNAEPRRGEASRMEYLGTLAEILSLGKC